MALLANIQAEYKLALQDPGLVIEINSNTDVRDASIKEAIREYSRRLPYIKTALVAPTSLPYYASPSGWLDGFSRIVAIESPIDQDPPAFLAPKSWRVIRREASQVIYIAPNPSGSFRLTFTAKHDETAPASIPTEHEGLLARWGAMVAAQSFMAYYSNTVQNNVDSVNYRTKEQEWRHTFDTLKAQIDNDLRVAEVRFQHDSDSGTYFTGWDV